MDANNLSTTLNTDTDDHEVVQYAGFRVRLGAFLIDNVLILLIVTPLLTLIYGVEYWQTTQKPTDVWNLLLTWVLPAFAMLLFWIYRSATPGKIMLGLTIVSENNHLPKLSASKAVFRYLGYYLALIPLGIGFFWIAFDKKKQGWHDKLANTVVINAEKR